MRERTLFSGKYLKLFLLSLFFPSKSEKRRVGNVGAGSGKWTEVEALTLLLPANELKGENSLHPPICALRLYYLAPDFF